MNRFGLAKFPLWSFGRDIKIAHSLFALPFAASAMVIGDTGWPTLTQGLLLIACMVSARSFAMGMNRFLDRHIDAQNPRTNHREIPAGRLSPRMSLMLSLVFGGITCACAFGLNDLAGILSIPLLMGLAGYSLLKRWTTLTHWYLGLCLGAAPCAVAVALRGSIKAPVVWLGFGVAFWTAGFDLLYSLQDMTFDRTNNLKSIPARYGPKAALRLSRACYALAVGSWALAGWLASRSSIYFGALGLLAVILAWEHWIVRDAARDGTSPRLNQAFFSANAWISAIYLAATLMDAWKGTWVQG